MAKETVLILDRLQTLSSWTDICSLECLTGFLMSICSSLMGEILCRWGVDTSLSHQNLIAAMSGAPILTPRQQCSLLRLLALLSCHSSTLQNSCLPRHGPLRGRQATHIQAIWAPTAVMSGAEYLWVLPSVSVQVWVSSSCNRYSCRAPPPPLPQPFRDNIVMCASLLEMTTPDNRTLTDRIATSFISLVICRNLGSYLKYF